MADNNNTPSSAGEEGSKPGINNNNNNNNSGPPFRSNRNRNRRNNETKKAPPAGMIKELPVFDRLENKADQVANFEDTDRELLLYLVRNKCNPLVYNSIKNGVLSLPKAPEDPKLDADGNADALAKDKWKIEYSAYAARKTKLEDDLREAFHTYIGQCTDEMVAWLKDHKEFEAAEENQDVIALRRILKNIVFDFGPTEDPCLTYMTALKSMFNCRQRNLSPVEYYKRFKETSKALTEMCGTGSFYNDDALVDMICREKGKNRDSVKTTTKAKYLEEGQERMLAMHFLMNCDHGRFGHLLQEFSQHYLSGVDMYPKTLQDAYKLLNNSQPKSHGKGGPGNKDKVGLSFNTLGDGDEDDNDNDSAPVTKGKKTTCSRCGKIGHSVEKCWATKHANGTILHTMGSDSITTAGDDNDDTNVSAGIHTNIVHSRGIDYEDLIFLHSNDDSPGTKSSNRGIPKTWLLLDSQATIDVICNADLITNIHHSDTTLSIRCNAGVKTTNLKGHLSGYGWVWYYPKGIANILSLSRVKERYRVTFDSATDNCFHVHKDNGKILKFKEANRRLYFFDTANRDERETVLITTVADNKSNFSAYDYSKAELARTIQKRIGRPSVQEYKRFVRMNLIPNCPITVQDIENAEFIWGPDLGCLKGKTVRRTPPQVRVTESDIPMQIRQQYKNVTLTADVMYVAKIPFLLTISKHIKLGSAGKLDSMDNSQFIKHFKTIIGTYMTRGFKVTLLLADNQFEPMRNELANLHVQLSVCANDEHVPEIERYIRTIKDRTRAIYNTLPFKHIPPLLVVEMVYSSVFWRNMFPIKGGISPTQSPAEIVLNRRPNFHAHCQLEFGEYVQTHEEHDNSMKSRTVGAIATRPSNRNDTGGYYFMNLSTGRLTHRRSWTPLPMPDDAVEQVHRLARRAKASKTLAFTNSQGVDLDTLYNDLDQDDDDLPSNAEIAGVGAEDDDDDDDSDYDPNDDDDDYDPNDDDDENTTSTPDDHDERQDDEQSIETTGVDTEADEEIPGVDNYENEEIPGVDNNENTGFTDNSPGGTEDMEYETSGVSTSDEENTRTYKTMNLRKQSRKHYNVFTTNGMEKQSDDEIILLTYCNDSKNGCEETMIDKDYAEYLFLTETLGWKHEANDNGCDGYGTPVTQDVINSMDYLFLNATEQMNWKRGIAKFGEKGENAIMKELQQVHDMEGFQPKHWYELTREERTRALKYLMYLKEKLDGTIKARGCADGRPQRLYTPKSETSSPTVSLTGLMLTCMIDAKEERDVATLDIGGAFLQAKYPENEKDVHVILEGRMAELLAKISPETYEEYVHHRRGQAYIYCKINVALYGTLKAALLFWKKLSKSLVARGFVINEYDWCVANKMINGTQCTIVWHVDDLKLSHIDPKVVDEIIASLQGEYGKISKMTVRRGKIHDYLGMTLDFSSPGSVAVSMEKYLDTMLEELPANMDGFASTPAADHLFKTRDNVDKLDKETADLFHRVTAQLLFVSQRGRPDIRTAISFLTKRVKAPDEDDYKKLLRVIKYIRKTKFLRLRIEATYLDQNHWFIDGAFAVHFDMKSHTGGCMTFGKGMLDGTSKGQKINTTSSTQAEVVGVHDILPDILWTRYFMEAQGYPLKPSVVHQDNQSAILLETNGRGSSSKRTRHMNIRYFFVADVQKRNEIKLQFCPTDEMIADFFTKPLGGAKFRRFRNIIMNIDHDEYGPVDIDEIMAIHHEKIQKRINVDGNKNDTESASHIESDSQECVGNGRQNVGQKKQAHDKPTYADVARRNTE